MNNLFVRRNGAELPRTQTEAEPFRLVHWDPFCQMSPFLAGEEQLARFTPDFEIKETKEGYVFKADVPGIKEKDLDISMTGNRLTISGKRETEKVENTDTYYARECSYGSFSRTFTLPEGTGGLIADCARIATFEPGELLLSLLLRLADDGVAGRGEHQHQQHGEDRVDHPSGPSAGEAACAVLRRDEVDCSHDRASPIARPAATVTSDGSIP